METKLYMFEQPGTKEEVRGALEHILPGAPLPRPLRETTITL